MPCPRLDKCTLPMALCSLVALMRWQEEYCLAEDFRECQRLRLAQRGQSIPDGMLPNGFVLPASD
jgi:hypothetical protein